MFGVTWYHIQFCLWHVKVQLHIIFSIVRATIIQSVPIAIERFYCLNFSTNNNRFIIITYTYILTNISRRYNNYCYDNIYYKYKTCKYEFLIPMF